MTKERKFFAELSDEDAKKAYSLIRRMSHSGKPVDDLPSMQKLEAMVGMGEVKDALDGIISGGRMTELAIARGRTNERHNYHCAFLGNPGTNKTSVAKLCGDLFFDAGITTKKNVVLAERGSLVGEHCGETPIKTRKLVESAMGGILFIDEAYSLVEDRPGGFGDEAINTLVALSDEFIGQFVMILAGYPDKMNWLFDTNPGLFSRVPNIVNFRDFTAPELVEITKHIAERKSFSIEKDVEEMLLPFYNRALQSDDFGNGRFVRNIVEKAISRRAKQIDFRKINELKDDEIFVLNKENFDFVEEMEFDVRKPKIGF